MVEDRLRDGTRIAQLLASELVGDRDALDRLSVVDANPDVDPDPDGALAYRVVVADARLADDGSRGPAEVPESDPADADELAAVYVQPERVRVEFAVGPDAAAEAGEAAGLRVRPKAVRPPRTLVFVEDGAEAKRVLPVFEAALDAYGGPGGE